MYVGLHDPSHRRVAHNDRMERLEAMIERLEARVAFASTPAPQPPPPAAVDIKQLEMNWHQMQLERERSSANMFMQQLSMVKEIMGIMQPVRQVVTPTAPTPPIESSITLETMERLAKVFKP